MTDFIQPQWPAAKHIKAFTTTRTGGFSSSPYDGFNMALHVGDSRDAVIKNRQLLLQQLPSEPVWLNQQHTTQCVLAEHYQAMQECDASYTQQANIICCVMTADCLPVLITDKQGSFVAAIHAGWRGLADGIIGQTVKAINKPAADMLIWLGPRIGKEVYQVGKEIRTHFIEKDPSSANGFQQDDDNLFLLDMALVAKQQLQALSIKHIYDCGLCTYSDQQQFYSYRRNKQTGRMASLIWMS